LSKGSISLVKNVLSGVFGAAGSITGAVGKVLRVAFAFSYSLYRIVDILPIFNAH